MDINNVKVLLVEDDEVDIESICRAFQKIHFPVELHIVKNGIEALHELFDENNKQHIKLCPDLIIMDINMPKMNGIEFLKQIRANELFKATKIIILTTSDNTRDKIDALKFNINGYLMKPIKTNELLDICNHLGNMARISND